MADEVAYRDRVPKRRARCSYTKVDDDLVIYDPASNRYLVLNGTAAFAWELMDGVLDIHGMAARLARDYDVDVEQVLSDLEELLDELEMRDLITWSR